MPKAAQSRREGAADYLANLLVEAGVGQDSVIRVTGPTGLGALLWFCEHGYRKVAYVQAGATLDEDCDLVFAPHPRDGAALETILRDGPPVREGRLLIVLSPQAKAVTAHNARDMLVGAGFRIEHCLQGRHRDVLVARRPVLAPVAQAA